MRSEKGQSTVELALILPVLMMLLMGMLDFGVTLHAYLALEHSGREAARAASIGKSDAEVIEVARNAFSLEDHKMTVHLSPSQANRKRGVYATVTLSYPIDFLTPMIGRFFPSPFVISNHTVMRVE